MSYCTKCGNELFPGSVFCAYCGEPVMRKRPSAPETPIDHTSERNAAPAARPLTSRSNSADTVRKLIQHIESLNKHGQIDQAIEYCDVILTADPSNSEILKKRDQLSQIITNPNVTIVFRASKRIVLQTSINNTMSAKYASGDMRHFTLNVGTYVVKFHLGSKRYERTITIADRYSKIMIHVAAGKMKNSIQII